MPRLFNHLHLVDWPFTPVPRPKHCTFIAGRPELRSDIESFLRISSRRDVSSIQVFWSWFGAGKTHSLHYMARRAEELELNSPPVQLHTLYTEFPRTAGTFFDVYRAWVIGLGTTYLMENFLEVATSGTSSSLVDEIREVEPDLEAAFRLITGGNQAERGIATHWLRGDQLPVSKFVKVGLSQRLAGTERTVTVMSLLLRVFQAAAQSQGRQSHRLIWLIDEFQRLERCSKKAIADISTGLHSLFNAVPTSLTLVFSFSGPPVANQLPPWFSPELRDRIGTTKVMILPPFNLPEAITFVSDILQHYRPEDSHSIDKFYPFTQETCEVIVDYLNKQTDLRPRVIMHAFDAVLSHAELLLEQRDLEVITPTVAKEVLKDYVIFSHEEDKN